MICGIQDIHRWLMMTYPTKLISTCRILYHWYQWMSLRRTEWIQIEMEFQIPWSAPFCQPAIDDRAWTSRKCSSACNFASSSLRDKALYRSNKGSYSHWLTKANDNERKQRHLYKSAPQRKQTQRQCIHRSFGGVTPMNSIIFFGPSVALLDAFGLTIAELLGIHSP